MVNRSDTHHVIVGYLAWLLWFYGSSPILFRQEADWLALWFFTLGLLGIGWLIDVVLIPVDGCRSQSEVSDLAKWITQ